MHYSFAESSYQATGIGHELSVWPYHWGGWVGLGQGLTWSPTHGPRHLSCVTRLGSLTLVSGPKAYRTVDYP